MVSDLSQSPKLLLSHLAKAGMADTAATSTPPSPVDHHASAARSLSQKPFSLNFDTNWGGKRLGVIDF